MAEQSYLHDRPLAVAGDAKTRHGIIVTANYIARKFGIKTGMNLNSARQLCPQLTVITPDKALYRRYSEDLHKIFRQYTSLIEPLSLDEAWLDMTESLALGQDPRPVAKELQDRVRKDVGITVSIGISINKMLAKQVSDWSKPSGLTVLTGGEVRSRLWNRPMLELFGCGPATSHKMAEIGIEDIGDLAQWPLSDILHQWGHHGLQLYLRAWGKDWTPVSSPSIADRRSVSAEHTTAADLSAVEDVWPWLQLCAQEVAERLRQLDLVGYRVGIKWRTPNFVTHNRQMMSHRPLNSADTIYWYARKLWNTANCPVRLVGISVSVLETPSRQLRFWDN